MSLLLQVILHLIFTFYILYYILQVIFYYVISIKKYKPYLLTLRRCQLYIQVLLSYNLKGFMKAEKCRCCVLLIKYIS